MLLLLLAACGDTGASSGCGPDTCDGCCDAEGVCQPGACDGADAGSAPDAGAVTDAGGSSDAGGLVNECALGTADCASDATCDDLPDGYRCTCRDGFEGDGRTCAPARARFRLIGSGARHGCALKTDATLWCWGDNVYGQLGIGAGPAATA
ncbi:MAG: EGF domain-containing protein, partial [Myxococcales bacterium]